MAALTASRPRPRAPPPASGRSLLLPLLLLPGLLPRAGARPTRSQPGPGGAQASVDLHPDPREPHGEGFEPRPGLEEGGDVWAFGKVHATVHHVLEHAPAGDAVAAVGAVEEFSAQHDLDFGLMPELSAILERVVQGAAASLGLSRPANSSEPAPPHGLHVLVMGSGFGSSVLKCLAALSTVRGQHRVTHELVSVEADPHLSNAGKRLLEHAIGSADDAAVQHTPLLPASDTTAAEVLEGLRDGYDLAEFDVVLLDGAGDRAVQEAELEAVLQAGVLREPGGVLYAAGPAEGAERLRDVLQRSSPDRFTVEAHPAGPSTAIVATLRDQGEDAEL